MDLLLLITYFSNQLAGVDMPNLELAFNLETNYVGVVLFASTINVRLNEGALVRTTRTVAQVSGGIRCGRVINALGESV
jgi:F0F1-type ATP synthase alpha subunit